MSDKVSLPIDFEETADLETAIQQGLVKVDDLLAQMRRDQSEIETLKIETKALREETAARLEALKKAV